MHATREFVVIASAQKCRGAALTTAKSAPVAHRATLRKRVERRNSSAAELSTVAIAPILITSTAGAVIITVILSRAEGEGRIVCVRLRGRLCE